jgi:hypothetical protein
MAPRDRRRRRYGRVRWFLWSRGRAVVSHATALAVHDLGVANPARIHLTVPAGLRQTNPAIVLHRASLDDRGLVSLAEPPSLERLLNRGFTEALRCSSDPLPTSGRCWSPARI